MIFLIYDDQVEEFNLAADVKKRVAAIINDEGDDVIDAITIIDGIEQTLEISRTIIIKPSVKVTKTRAKTDAKKK